MSISLIRLTVYLNAIFGSRPALCNNDKRKGAKDVWSLYHSVASPYSKLPKMLAYRAVVGNVFGKPTILAHLPSTVAAANNV